MKHRLRELEFWSWGYAQLHQSGKLAQVFAEGIRGTLLQEAIAQLGNNNLTLAQAVKTLCKKNRFGNITVQSSVATAASEAAFKQSSHQNHMMFFFSCGLYEFALRENYLQSDLMACWNQMLDLQASHILFFVNWLAFESHVRQKPEYELSGLWSLFELRSQWFSILKKLNRSEYDDNLPNNPKNIDYFLGKHNLSEFLDVCEQGYCSRFESFDEQLIRPRILIQTSRAFRTLLGFWPQRVNQTRPSSV